MKNTHAVVFVLKLHGPFIDLDTHVAFHPCIYQNNPPQKGSKFYGPGGAYAKMAGKDAT